MVRRSFGMIRNAMKWNEHAEIRARPTKYINLKKTISNIYWDKTGTTKLDVNF